MNSEVSSLATDWILAWSSDAWRLASWAFLCAACARSCWILFSALRSSNLFATACAALVPKPKPERPASMATVVKRPATPKPPIPGVIKRRRERDKKPPSLGDGAIFTPPIPATRLDGRLRSVGTLWASLCLRASSAARIMFLTCFGFFGMASAPDVVLSTRSVPGDVVPTI